MELWIFFVVVATLHLRCKYIAYLIIYFTTLHGTACILHTILFSPFESVITH